MLGEHLGDGELVDIPGPGAEHVLFPSLPVGALLSQQIAQVPGGRAAAGRARNIAHVTQP